MQLEDRILHLGQRLERIADRLRRLGYHFEEPAEVFPGPAPDADAAIERIEREVGAVPLAIKVFWRSIGGVNFMGHHPGWQGCDYPDPIVVFPPAHTIAELDEFLDDREERLRHNFPYRIPIAPDAFQKQGVGGGMWYNLSVAATADDPPLNDERHQITFANYLELAARSGGFPGLDRCPNHTYPLDEIRGE